MSILSRIGRIIRANLKTGSGEESPGSDTFYQEYQRRKRIKENFYSKFAGDSDDERQPDKPQQDPQLAKYYANLEVPYGSDLETVRRAWKDLLRKYHPDLHSGDAEKQQLANKLVQELNHAYQELAKKLSM